MCKPFELKKTETKKDGYINASEILNHPIRLIINEALMSLEYAIKKERLHLFILAHQCE